MTVGADRRQFTLPLLLLFVGSGCAALIYEVVWFQLLRFVVGASSISLGFLLASFMGGMLLGSFFFHRVVAMRHHPLRVYALLELSIGAFGLLLPLLLPLVTHFYVSFAGYGLRNMLLRGLVCGLCLLPPAALMGATLPAVARFMETSREGIARLGLFYAANIAGGVLGTLLASFHLLRSYDVRVASAWAVALNVGVAAVALGLARLREHEATGGEVGPEATPVGGGQLAPAAVYLAVGLSGLTALGAQVVWTRLLSLLLGATVYSFSLILAVFLIGLGIGSHLGALTARRVRDAGLAFAACQILLIFGIPYAASAIGDVLPNLHFVAVETGWAWHRADDLMRCAVAILPATLLWGASFPLALASVRLPDRDLGRLTGRVYAANTGGAILGALVFSIVAIPEVGTRVSQQILTGLAALAALVVLIPIARRVAPGSPAASRPRPRLAAAAAMVIVALIGGNAVRIVPRLPDGMLTYGRTFYDWETRNDILISREGRNATVAVTREAETSFRNLHVSGKVVASTHPEDMRIERMLGHLPALLHPNPKSVLIVGFGTGVTSGVFTLYPGIERIVIVEIEPEVPALAGGFFEDVNYGVLSDPRTRVVFDDARHFVATTDEKFDIITSDPIHPWVKGAAALYTTEYFELCKQRLNPGGVVAQWVPFYQTNESAVKSEIATFLDAFPGGSVWNTLEAGRGYDVTLFGPKDGGRIDAARIQRHLETSPRIRASLGAVGITSALDLLQAFAGQRRDLERWLADAEPNADRNLRLEYLAGEALDLQIGDDILGEMTRHLAYPEALFVVTPAQEVALRRALARQRR